MLQLQTFRLQKQQRLYKLIGKTLDVLNVLIVNLVRDICSVGDLVNIVGDIIRQHVEPFQLVFVYVNDISLKDHRTDKSAECVHTAVCKFPLDSVHFCLTHSYLQVQIALILVFHILFLSSLCFYKFGVVGAAPSAKLCIMWVRSRRAHMIQSLLLLFRPCGAICISELFSSDFFSCIANGSCATFLCFSLIAALRFPISTIPKISKTVNGYPKSFFGRSETTSSK